MRMILESCRRLTIGILMTMGVAGHGLVADENTGDETNTLAFRNLQRLVQEEERILSHAREPDGTYDIEQVQRGFQDLVREYEVFLADNPDYAAGYVAYGLMLDRAGETRIASRMFMRADELDPEIPVVKNQLGNYMVENDRPVHALPYFLTAIELEPEEALYYYQLGNLLAEYRDEFLGRGMYEAAVLDEQLQKAFRKARELTPDEIAYAYRYAESYYDVEDPDWDAALEAWDSLTGRLRPGVELQTIYLQQANVHLLNDDPGKATELLENVTEPALQSNKERLLERLP